MNNLMRNSGIPELFIISRGCAFRNSDISNLIFRNGDFFRQLRNKWFSSFFSRLFSMHPSMRMPIDSGQPIHPDALEWIEWLPLRSPPPFPLYPSKYK